MVEEIATVVASEQDGLWLTTSPAGSCNSCQVSGDCGTGIVAKTFTPRQRRFFVKSDLALLPGEQVRIGMAEQSLVTAALLVYLLPLLLMIVSITLLHSLWSLPEPALLLVAAVALYAGFRLARWLEQRLSSDDSVQILQVLPQLKVHSG